MCSVAMLGPQGAPTCHLSIRLQSFWLLLLLLLADGVIHAACCCAGWPGSGEAIDVRRGRPSKHYSVATSTTETSIHRLSHFTGFHEIRSPGSHAPQDRCERCKGLASCIIQKDYCASSSGDFEAWGGGGSPGSRTTDCITFCLSMTKHLIFVVSSSHVHMASCVIAHHGFTCAPAGRHRNVREPHSAGE